MALFALLRSSLRAFGNTGRMVRQQSLLKVVVILCCAASLFIGLGVIFFQGFEFLHSLGGAGLMVIHRLFALFFFALAIMLIFSSVATSYSTMYRSDEVPSLLVRPVPLGELALYKFFESAIFASWAFFFMILPFIGAYAIHEKLSPLFAVWTLLFAVPFVLVCSAVGSILCMLLVRWLPSGRALYLLLGGLLSVLLALGVRLAAAEAQTGDDTTLVLTRLIPGMRISAHPLLPSWWIAEGIMGLARGQWARGALLWGVTMSNALMLCLVIEALGRRIYYAGWLKGQVSSRRARRSGGGRAWLDLPWLSAPRDSRALVSKDIRMFARDPAQWSQVVVFFGLLGVYFLNLRQLHYHLLAPEWRNLIVFLNMFSVSAVICSLSSRFVYPQMSLEGHSFWILGLSPLSMARVVRAKFRLAAGFLVAISIGLMLIATTMLDVAPLLKMVASAAAACICIVVTALAVGLGAIFMDLKERNPAAIVSSFGGTLNLVLCMSYTFVVLIPLAALFHAYTLDRLPEATFRHMLLGAVAAMFLLTALCAWIPLRLGTRSLQRREY